ncbi:hypothetical protein Ssi03_25560 [Sphaerisporangium siamense]|uniref:Uncharacterized protein n=1 Tax=Sphaerisporangium siamense TaxID=795645 RepID=A0A7W7G915_9ACTN|nr:hypothetical protein [Sphaerisporangium siamense]MBB4700119.1 hypothetical protein [Sphaerisporangium siamense]GII84566.1 hypothetical protein Ssi03_25560 [Sphaerisporangium siamense]
MTTETTEPGQVRPFAAVLGELRHGAVLDQASVDLQALVAKVVDTGKKGKLVLTVEVGPMKGNPDALLVNADVKTTAPVVTNEAVFFPDRNGNLQRDDPRQAAIPGLRIAPGTDRDNVKDLSL